MITNNDKLASQMLKQLKDYFKTNRGEKEEEYRRQIFDDKDEDCLQKAFSAYCEYNQKYHPECNKIDIVNTFKISLGCNNDTKKREEAKNVIDRFLTVINFKYKNIYTEQHKNDVIITDNLMADLIIELKNCYDDDDNKNILHSCKNIISVINSISYTQSLIRFLVDNEDNKNILKSFCKKLKQYLEDRGIYIEQSISLASEISVKTFKDIMSKTEILGIQDELQKELQTSINNNPDKDKKHQTMTSKIDGKHQGVIQNGKKTNDNLSAKKKDVKTQQGIQRLTRNEWLKHKNKQIREQKRKHKVLINNFYKDRLCQYSTPLSGREINEPNLYGKYKPIYTDRYCTQHNSHFQKGGKRMFYK